MEGISMNLKNLLMATAAVGAFFGLLFLLVPAATMDFYGVTLDEAGVWVARLLGASFLGYAAVAWLARDAEASRARRAIEVGYFTGFAIGFVVDLVGQLAGWTNGLGWVNVIIYLLFAAAFGYFAFMRPEAAQPRMAG
jgi:hypothetical protein